MNRNTVFQSLHMFSNLKHYQEIPIVYTIKSYSEDLDYLYFLVTRDRDFGTFIPFNTGTEFIIRCTHQFEDFIIKKVWHNSYMLVREMGLNENTKADDDDQEKIIQLLHFSKMKLGLNLYEESETARDVFFKTLDYNLPLTEKHHRIIQKKERQKRKKEALKKELSKKKRQFYKPPHSKHWER